MENQNNEKEKENRVKKIYDIEISEFEFFCIRMISDYLFLDRFNDSASFIRFEQCFGPLFSNKDTKFKLVEAYKEIVGKRKKYITFRRMIKSYINWKKKLSNNYSFNFFMNEIFNNMIIKKGEAIGKLVEGERVFSTKNCKNRKIITKLSVQTDKAKNKINGFILEYDEIFKSILCIKEKPEDINLEIHFNLFNTNNSDKLSQKLELDRDGITHIAGKFEENTGIIKFLIFKCRSGKTMYIGDSTEKEDEKISSFIFGSSKSQLKALKIGLIKDQLSYIEPKYQISTRINENLNIKFEDLNEQYIENDLLKFEEKEYENASDEQIGNTEEEKKKFLYQLIPDDQFVDKMNLLEEKNGKNFKEIYRSYFEEGKSVEKFKEIMKKVVQDNINKENREEKLRAEKNNLMDNLYYKKNNFDSVFVKLIKFKNKMKDKTGKEENEEFIEEEDEDDDDLNLIKIRTGEYLVKKQYIKNEQNKQNVKNEKDLKNEQNIKNDQILRANKVNENKEKEPKDNVNNKSNQNNSKNEKTDNNYNNHKIVEIKYTNKKNNNKEPQDNVKK